MTGLVVSALNHVATKTGTRNLIDRRLKANGYNPDGAADIYQSQLSDFAEEIFPELMNQTDSPSFTLKDKIITSDGSRAYGVTPGVTVDGKTTFSGIVQISRDALSSYRMLASTIGHELNHVYHFISGAYDRWARKFDYSYADARSEYSAQRWEVRAGGLPTMSILNENYNVMLSYHNLVK